MENHTTVQEYATPELRDYGSLEELTAAQAFTGPEDGASKLIIHHESPEFS